MRVRELERERGREGERERGGGEICIEMQREGKKDREERGKN